MTEYDLLHSLKVKDVQDSDVPAFSQHVRVTDIMHTVADTDAMHYAVLDDERHVLGTITIDSLKRCLADMEMGAWLVADDLLEPVIECEFPETSLAEAIQRLRDARVEAVPVVSCTGKRYEGMLELRRCEKRISQEVWRRRRKADDEGIDS